MAKSARARSTCAAGALGERLRRVKAIRSSGVSGRRGSFRWRDMGHLGARGAPIIIPEPAANDPLVLLRHELVWCGGLWKWVAQHGHRSRLRARATVSLRCMVAIEFGTCRSGRIGGAAGSITRGKANRFELRGGRS